MGGLVALDAVFRGFAEVEVPMLDRAQMKWLGGKGAGKLLSGYRNQECRAAEGEGGG